MMWVFHWALFVLLSVAFATEDTPELTPEFIDDLLAQKRYEDLEKYMGFTIANLTRPNEIDSLANPMFNPGLFEGDILLPRPNEQSRQGLRNNIWPGRRPAYVPVALSNQFSQQDRRTIINSLAHWNSVIPCLKFYWRSNQRNYIFITPANGCWAHLGMTGGEQWLSLGGGCVHRPIILHELEHAVGIHHEQTRGDRDEYIEMLWHNIPENWRGAYEKNDNAFRLLGRYDYYSIMHYTIWSPGTGRRAYNVRKPGIDENRIGKAQDFSWRDRRKIAMMYC